jgi:plastocyanin
MRQVVAAICVLALSACTPGADHSGPSGGAIGASTTTVDVNLTLHQPTTIAAGLAGGYAPIAAVVPLGSTVRFINSDSFAHTASFVGATTFPSASPFNAGDLNAYGGPLSQDWSSGTLQPGAASQLLVADKRGTFLFGCFFHYGSPMRAAIVVQ